MGRAALFAFALAAAAAAAPAGAILIRADRDDAEYRELATRYPAAVRLTASGGSGALVAPRWILTSATLARSLRAGPGALRVAGEDHHIQAIFLHPEWKPGAEADIALVFLREGVGGREPAPIYRLADEAGQAARIVGAGATGRIGEAPSAPDGATRAAINTVDRVRGRTLGLRIKGPEDASDLQGALAPGESGTPAFLEAGGRIYLGAIATGTEDSSGDGIAGNAGDWETYARVSAFADWLDDVMSRAAVEEAARETAARRPR